MNCTSLRLLGLLFLGLSGIASAQPPIALNDDEAIRIIENLDGRVDQLIAKVRQCAAAGLAPMSECHCRYPVKLESAREAYEEVLMRHPEWENRAVLWWDAGEPRPSNLHMGGLKNRFDQPCS